MSFFFPFSFSFLKHFYLFIVGCTRSSLLAQAFSSCGEWGSLHCGTQSSPCVGFSYCAAQALGAQASVAYASVAVVHGLSCSVACEISLDQESNPCSLH